MDLTFTFTAGLPDEQHVFELFLTTGWNEAYRITPTEFIDTLRNSWNSWSAYADEKLVGFGRIVCDGVLHALILDLIVYPDQQRKGIGGEIFKALVD